MTPRIVEILYQMIAFLFAISVHESAHAWTASRCGDPTARMLGRVSLNPIRHIDPIGTIVLPLIAGYRGGLIGWAKPTPVDPRNFRHPVIDDILTSVAGPVSNFIVATAALLILGCISLSSATGRTIIMGLSGGFDVGVSDSMWVPIVMLLYMLMACPAARRQSRAAAFSIGSGANGIRPHRYLCADGTGLSSSTSSQQLNRPAG